MPHAHTRDVIVGLGGKVKHENAAKVDRKADPKGQPHRPRPAPATNNAQFLARAPGDQVSRSFCCWRARSLLEDGNAPDDKGPHGQDQAHGKGTVQAGYNPVVVVVHVAAEDALTKHKVHGKEHDCAVSITQTAGEVYCLSAAHGRTARPSY